MGTVAQPIDAMMEMLNKPPASPPGSTPAQPVSPAPASGDSGSLSAAPVADQTPAAGAVSAGDDEDFKFSDEKDASQNLTAPEPDKTAAAPAAGASPEAEKPAEGDPVTNLSKLLEDPNALPAQIEAAFLKTARGQRQLEAFKFHRDLEKPVEEGGLGYSPSAQEIRSFAEKAQEYDNIVFETEMGSPQGLLNRFFAVDQQGKPTAGAISALQTLGNHIAAQNSPELYEAYSAQMRKVVLDRITDHFARMPVGEKDSPDQKARDAAIWVHNNILSQIYRLPPLDPKASIQARAEDPNARIVQENQRLREEQNRRDMEAYNGVKNHFVNQFNLNCEQRMLAYVDEAMAAILPSIPDIKVPDGKNGMRPLRDMYRGEYIAKAHEATQANKMRYNQIYQAIGRAVDNNFDRTQAKGAEDLYVATAREAIRNLRTSYLKDVRQDLSKFGAPVNQPGQQVINGVAQPKPVVIPAGGQPVPPQNPNALPDRLPGESNDDYNVKVLQALTQRDRAAAAVNGRR